MNDFQVRRADASDVASIAALGIQVWLDTYTEGVSALCADFVLQEFAVARVQASIAQHDYWVAVQNELLLGYIVVDPSCVAPWGAEVCKLYVQARWQGKGVGVALLAMAKQNFPQFWLSVYHANAKAIQFYQGQGLSQVGKTDFMMGNQRHENYIFALASA
ncbi:GNAT family N-acetyltransferase [Deefgea rivuli]|uniref:GNAT family N-acetyltransferase n=1 Tax=Deefgea rivuli TaxID=400948 RepID=UPI00048041B8|nr:GNAT family N-acetyltransferase [Deefgea rivuli]